MSEKTVDIPQEDLRKIQLKSLELFLYFQKICEENGLLCYFCGGGCIGALRHGGFIPWDDDIDVFMPREDYEKLKRVWNDKADTRRYSYEKTSDTEYTRLLFATISDNETAFIKNRQCDLYIAHGIRLDILPIDGCPDSRFKRKMQIVWALLYSMYITGEAPTSKGRVLFLIGKMLLALAPTRKMRYHMWRLAERRMSRFEIKDCKKVTELCARYQYMVNEYPAEAFKSKVYKKFEGVDVPLPVGYEEYLKMAFGDYMQMPSLEKQVAKHGVVWYDTEHSYKKYENIYYGKGKDPERGEL